MTSVLSNTSFRLVKDLKEHIRLVEDMPTNHKLNQAAYEVDLARGATLPLSEKAEKSFWNIPNWNVLA